MAEQAYVDHLISRLISDVEFLVSQGMTEADKALIIQKLTAQPPAPSPVAQLERQVSTLTVSSGVSGRAVPPPPAPKPKLVQAVPARKLCKAVWDYPAAAADDLGFKAGQMIEIVEEENADWWRGQLDGRSGLFPSNHVERLPDAVAPSPAPTSQRFVPPPPPLSHASSYSSNTPSYQSSQNQHYGEKQPYQYDQSQQGQMQPHQYQPPAGQQQVVAQEQAPPKKKFGAGMGRQLGNAAVGGVGFGAGAAIGSGLINSVF